MGEFRVIEDDGLSEEPDLPAYEDRGRILFYAWGSEMYPYEMEYDVIDYDGHSSVHWISEGEGLEYWISEHCGIVESGWYVVTGIWGLYYRGDWSRGEDDDVTWYYDSVRPATAGEIRNETLGEEVPSV